MTKNMAEFAAHPDAELLVLEARRQMLWDRVRVLPRKVMLRSFRVSPFLISSSLSSRGPETPVTARVLPISPALRERSP